jgi:hypothetical protein
MSIIDKLKQLKATIRFSARQEMHFEAQKLLLAKLLVENVKNKEKISSFEEVEFKVFSQFGDDGIIQWLIHHIDILHKTFIEFGVEDYREANTRFLMMNDNWSGLVMDGSMANISKIIESEYYWKHELIAKSVFIDLDNINDEIAALSFNKDVGILHIDLDGNDYWIWKDIHVITPIIVIMEYNSVFGKDRAITVPYDKTFNRTKAHHSNLYFGASLPALHQLALQKGYAFIGCNSAGNNAYFVRRDNLNDNVKEVPLEQGYVLSKIREARASNGKLTYARGEERIKVIRGLPVYNVINDKVEAL